MRRLHSRRDPGFFQDRCEPVNAIAARRYEAIDRRAGFVKHAEVYVRKKARADAIRRAPHGEPGQIKMRESAPTLSESEQSNA